MEIVPIPTRESDAMKILLEPVVLKQLALAKDLHPSVKETHLKLCLHPKMTIAENAKQLEMPYDKLRRHIRKLQDADWAYTFVESKTRRTIIVPSMPLRVEEMLAEHWQMLRNFKPFFGQWITNRWFTLLVDDIGWIPNARPESLVSGDGSKRMEIDFLFERHRVAVEFNGKFHFEAGPTPEEQEKLREQQQRDATKALLCARKNMVFVEITGKDLSHETIESKLGHVLPLIPPRKNRPVFRLLDDFTHSYGNYLRQ